MSTLHKPRSPLGTIYNHPNTVHTVGCTSSHYPGRYVFHRQLITGDSDAAQSLILGIALAMPPWRSLCRTIDGNSNPRLPVELRQLAGHGCCLLATGMARYPRVLLSWPGMLKSMSGRELAPAPPHQQARRRRKYAGTARQGNSKQSWRGCSPEPIPRRAAALPVG